MSRFNKKQAFYARNCVQRDQFTGQPLAMRAKQFDAPTVVFSSELSAKTYGRTESFGYRKSAEGKPVFYWAPYQFLKRSQRKRRLIARRRTWQ